MELVNDSPRVLGNRYEVGDLLGRGGMAEVHLGRDARLGRTVAIKLLRSDLARDHTFQARFRREAQSAAALNHPAIVAVYDTGEEQVTESGGAIVNLPYIVMEHVEGKTLRDTLGEGHHLDVDAALDITTGVLTALEYSHRIGIVHRDIKPANVMLTPVGDVKVMDFGIARAMADASSTMTQTQAVIGTAQYLSPEQARGEQVDTRSDLYSAGCMLFELLTGRPPFVADSPVAVAYQHVREQPVPPSRLVAGIPETVDRIVLHALAKGRDERYQTAAEFRADVEAARGGRQINAAVPAMTGSNAATQYVPPVHATGTRGMPAVSGAGGYGGLLGAETTGAGGLSGPGGPGGPYDPYGQNGDLGSRRDQRPQKSNRAAITLGVLVLVILAVVGFFVARSLTGNKPGSTASSQISMPGVVGQAQAIAETTLRDQGFTNVTSQNAPSATVAVGQVSSQDPPKGQQVLKSAAVVLTISSGPDSITMPNVAGQTLADAKKYLTDHGLTVGETKYEVDATKKAGQVTRTDPAAGDPTTAERPVTIYVASSSVTIPDDLIGLPVGEAKAELTKLSLSSSVTEVVDESTPGTVLATNPNAGTAVKRGSKVVLTVAKAPQVTVTATPTAPPTTPPSTEPSPTPSGT